MLRRELGEQGYAGVDVRATPRRTEIVIKATKTQDVLGERYQRIRELSSLVQRRHNFPEGNLELFAQRVNNRGLCALAQAEALLYKLNGGLSVRRACYGILRFIMESGAKGCEIVVTGKLRAQRASVMKFRDGYMLKTGGAAEYFVDKATRHLNMKQGVLGLSVAIMLPQDPTGENGVAMAMPDVVTIREPKVEASSATIAPSAVPARAAQNKTFVGAEAAAPVPVIAGEYAAQAAPQEGAAWPAQTAGDDAGW